MDPSAEAAKTFEFEKPQGPLPSLGTREDFVNGEHNLDCFVQRQFLSKEEEKALFHELKELPWFRVKYCSERFGNECTTPCWTNFFGGFPEIKPYQPIPEVFTRLVKRVQLVTPGVEYNAILLRLYFDGQDNITWHTDGRSFLGDTPTIASLSLGSRSSFELRKMTNVWPCKDTPNGGIDRAMPQIQMSLSGGDMLVMQGKTQQSWHHRVPQEKRGPRININFRYILPNRDETSVRGVRAFYKYMVCGDSKTEGWDMTAPSFKYADIVKQYGPMHAFVTTNGKGEPVTTTPSPAAAAVDDHQQIADPSAIKVGDSLLYVKEGAADLVRVATVHRDDHPHLYFTVAMMDGSNRERQTVADHLRLVAAASDEGESERPCPACTLLNEPKASVCAACGIALEEASISIKKRKTTTATTTTQTNKRSIASFFSNTTHQKPACL